MEYKEFISLFNKDFKKVKFGEKFFYYKYLKIMNNLKKDLKEEKEVDFIFLNFVMNLKVKGEKIFKLYEIYKRIKEEISKEDIEKNLIIIYFLIKNNNVDINEFNKFNNLDTFYNNYFSSNDLYNLNIFLDNFDFLNNYNLKDKTYNNSLNFEEIDLKGDLSFLKFLNIEKVKGDLVLRYIDSLKNLRGLPRVIDGDFVLEGVKIEEIGFEEKKEVLGYFYFLYNLNLKNLKGLNISIGKDFYCEYNNNLEYLDIDEECIVDGDFYCFYNKNLKSLRGLPKKIYGGLVCKYNDNLEYLDVDKDVYIEYNFICNNNKNLKSLRNNPKIIRKDFVCNNCGLNEIDLDYGTEIKGNLYCLEGNNVTRKQVEEYIKKNNIILRGRIK